MHARLSAQVVIECMLLKPSPVLPSGRRNLTPFAVCLPEDIVIDPMECQVRRLKVLVSAELHLHEPSLAPEQLQICTIMPFLPAPLFLWSFLTSSLHFSLSFYFFLLLLLLLLFLLSLSLFLSLHLLISLPLFSPPHIYLYLYLYLYLQKYIHTYIHMFLPLFLDVSGDILDVPRLRHGGGS